MEGTVIDISEARQRRAEKQKASRPAWGADIKSCCVYAELVKAEHAAERARIDWDLHDCCIECWWEGPEHIQERVHANNREWERYIALLVHIAELPAKTRREAQMKRHAIGVGWLKPDGCLSDFGRMRAGCMADDHLFPPSLRLDRLKGTVRVS